VRRSKVGLDLAGPGCYEALAGSDKAASGTSALKTCCQEVQFQAVVFAVVTTLKLVSFAGRTFRCLLLRGPSASSLLCAPGAALAFGYAVR
jgi:hypothetical protein